MKNFSLAFLLLFGACGSQDDPEPAGPAPVASPETDAQSPDTESGPTIPPQEGALLPLEWAFTDFGQATYLNVGQLDFGPDDSLVVGSTIDDRSTNQYAPCGRIDRFTADGAPLWTISSGSTSSPADMPVPEESDTIQIDAKAVHLASIDHTADGRILVAFNVELDYYDYESEGGFRESTRSYIRSYDLDGNVLDTILLGGTTDFPAQDSVDELPGSTASAPWTTARSCGAAPPAAASTQSTPGPW